MEQKQVSIQNGEYICDIDVSVDEWKSILVDETLMFSTYKNALVKFYNEPDHKSTCKSLGEKYNENPQHFNSVITNFAKAVQKKLNRFKVLGTDGTPSYWIIPMRGKYTGNYFEWTLRPELVQAMEESGMTVHSFFAKEDFELFEQYINLLKTSKNLIFTGAPGTGKTYLAKQIAKQMIGVTTDEELEKSGQFAFVQFHPSYDYTDFVEGLRPAKPDENGNIGFELKDGIFKEFCKRAINIMSGGVDNFNEIWDILTTNIKNELANGKLIKIGSWDYGLSRNNTLKYSSENTPSRYSFTLTKQNIYDAYINKQARPSGAFQKEMEDVVNYMKNNLGLKDFKTGTISDKKFVFIIDEINRGEISKIFGELFFSIDPGYRGEKGAVKTQYSNLHDDENELFYIPENVFIIGTMNDIDRSVESFDFAMRRRFTWKEITAEESQKMLDSEIWKDEAIKRMNNLNNAIWNKEKNIDGLNSSYHIGAAYFKNNLSKYENEEKPFDKLWEYHLKPLLFEYLRGTQNAQENLIKLENAYNAE